MAWEGRALAAPCVHWPHARSRRLNARAAHRGCIYAVSIALRRRRRERESRRTLSVFT